MATEKLQSPIQPEQMTFVMVGCQRCGTTWVDAALREHPEVYLPPQKQSYFFDRAYGNGLAWYLSRFEGVEERHRAVGEIATGYCLPHAVPRLAQDLPHVKLMMTMRHPIERAFSNYQSRKAERGWRSFEHAVRGDPDLIERGRYIDQIEALLAHYPRERLLLLLYDDLIADDRAFLRRIHEHLGVDPDVPCSMIGQRKNVSGLARLRRSLGRMGLKPVLRGLSRSPIGAAVRKRRKGAPGPAPSPIEPALRQELIEAFRPYNERLAALLNRDLSAWNARTNSQA